ncbi:glucosaminidase [Sneathiella chungangensis]|uniref:Glucosaminidase n=1 Tax=Sneathiella chungangensis TaxID=1418234 RepID=A0A845MGI5_9PROT|nr:glucosaminidase domain-containing protein [Sneathiella chungangensis]MZR22446.1 glucosaminidase [Sneathiella chungangensis]
MKGFRGITRAGSWVLVAGLLMLSAASLRAETVTIRDFDEFADFFDRNGYSIQKWKAREQDVPPYVILDIPEEWRKKVAPELPVAEKKRTFLRLTIPLAFVANHALRHDREKLEQIRKELQAGQTLSPHDEAWLKQQAADYALASHSLNDEFWAEMARRMDVVPPSLIVAQMVEESGWGTSRFAAEGNALFGQWSYKGGIKPEEQRKAKGDYRIEAFKTPLDSVRAYMLNLNSHDAYKGFRERRAAIRADGKPVTGPDLVDTLIAYSERREAYVRIISEIMERNGLPPLDHAQIAAKKVTYLELE